MFLGPDDPSPIDLNLVDLIANASLPVQIVVGILVAAALFVWIIATLKLLQLGRASRAEARFEHDISLAQSAEEMFDIAAAHESAPGARVVLALARRRSQPKALPGVAKRAIVSEQVRASLLMPTLSSIAAASPFVGLFGTVWGIMDAFLRIGREKSASLPVVAPAIGEALFATLIGLVAAIPAVVTYNAINKRVDDLLSGVEASAEGWVAIAGTGLDARATHALPLSRRPDKGTPSRPTNAG
ncbi:MAG: MotA/TolQ/ExbB proton channel family protein [Myxococcales bacterium]|nr:MotA/TolQ/ExbB proton channel family protein [Myxococcales bacterium]